MREWEKMKRVQANKEDEESSRCVVNVSGNDWALFFHLLPTKFCDRFQFGFLLLLVLQGDGWSGTGGGRFATFFTRFVWLWLKKCRWWWLTRWYNMMHPWERGNEWDDVFGNEGEPMIWRFVFFLVFHSSCNLEESRKKCAFFFFLVWSLELIIVTNMYMIKLVWLILIKPNNLRKSNSTKSNTWYVWLFFSKKLKAYVC